MPVLSRLQVPEEFYDRTSDILLVQPEPQYTMAELWRLAMMVSMPEVGNLMNPGRPPLLQNGAAYSQFERDQFILSTGLPQELFATKVKWDAEPGDTIRFNRPSYANTTYTLDSRRIGRGVTISTTPVAVTSEQTTLTLGRFGGPYDQVNGRVAPLGLDTFDWQMGVHKVEDMVGSHMRRDLTRFIDTALTLLGDNGTIIRPTGMVDNDTPTATDDYPLDVDTCQRTRQSLVDGSVPSFSDGKYILKITPTQRRQIESTRDWQFLSQFNPEFNVLFPKTYVRDFLGFHVLESVTNTTATNTSSVTINYAQAFGRDVFLAGLGKAMPGIYPASDDNFGQTPKAIWLLFAALGLADSRFCRSIRTG
jgi:hypothetical protein